MPKYMRSLAKWKCDTCNESLDWLNLENNYPIWSRRFVLNTAGRCRNDPSAKLNSYDVEVENCLWSLWEKCHFKSKASVVVSRGNKYLACNVLACCAAKMCPLMDWDTGLLKTIAKSGRSYYRQSLRHSKQDVSEFGIEDLNVAGNFGNNAFNVKIVHTLTGTLYCAPTPVCMNLSVALTRFFSLHQFGVLQCQDRSLAIGHTPTEQGGYFMYDYQGPNKRLFAKGKHAAYVLRTPHLQVLLYCIVVTLNVPSTDVDFTLHSVNVEMEMEMANEKEMTAEKEMASEKEKEMAMLTKEKEMAMLTKEKEMAMLTKEKEMAMMPKEKERHVELGQLLKQLKQHNDCKFGGMDIDGETSSLRF